MTIASSLWQYITLQLNHSTKCCLQLFLGHFLHSVKLKWHKDSLSFRALWHFCSLPQWGPQR